MIDRRRALLSFLALGVIDVAALAAVLSFVV